MWNDTVLDAIRLTDENVVDLSDCGRGKFSLVNRKERPQMAKNITWIEISRLKNSQYAIGTSGRWIEC